MTTTLETTTKRITLATLKSFIRKNAGRLWIQQNSRFDGSTDCVQFNTVAKFSPAHAADETSARNLGIAGVWVVGNSRDYFTPFSQHGLSGYTVSNCCGSFVLAVFDENYRTMKNRAIVVEDGQYSRAFARLSAHNCRVLSTRAIEAGKQEWVIAVPAARISARNWYDRPRSNR